MGVLQAPPAAEGFDGFSGLAATSLAAAIAVLALALLIVAWRWFSTRPRLPQPGPATADLGAESPAIANLLVHRCRVTRLAVPATLIDLAARRYLGIEQYGERFVVRVRDRASPGDNLLPFERQVFDWVRDRATGGSAPVEALDLGSAAAAASWWKRFQGGVIDEAEGRGLVRRRWAAGDWTLFGIVLAIGLSLLAWSFGEARLGEAFESDDPITGFDWLLFAGGAWLAGMAAVRALPGLRETRAGMEASARWLGVRRYLDDSNAFETIPPAAVVIWERYLAYATALGIAREAAEELPFAAEDPETAWSRATGHWREVRIRYRRWFGFGQAPWKVFLAGLALTAAWGFGAFYLLPTGASIAWTVGQDIIEETSSGTTSRDERILLLTITGIAAFLGILAFSQLVRGVVRLWRGGLDLGKAVVVEGEVVKVHAGRAALDDGESGELDAWFIPPGAAGVARGAKVRLTRSPRLHHVRKVELVSAATVGERDDAARAGAVTGTAARRTMPALGELLGGLTGLTLTAGAEASSPYQRYSDGEGNAVQVVIAAAPAGPIATALSLAARASPGAGGITQVGERAWWIGGQQLVVEDAPRLLTVSVDLPEKPEAERQRIAIAVAREALGLGAGPPA